ncbi:hypothetical protein BO71DRAFT_489239 [Aspergillus ellipticus CBS 707.79]|uniref:Zn(2)-C6 fungal-type domain-containing protein n=1 Tax=Aspergillus ellipticus CBS 707.79 TaxID=1448320 RepID=A0A319E9T9_9EURO|nr:hypothetical protein BO71DRAFT_489239 [Aspergillus ellipticus CBS 707.79]
MDLHAPAFHGRATRSSLACLPCRSRHLKCDGKRPCCTRCAQFSRQCDYARSRRGGLDRAALEERRKRLAAADTAASAGTASSPSSRRSAANPPRQEVASPMVGVEFPSYGLLEGLGAAVSPEASSPITNIENDPLIDSYYQNFHDFHPFLLPQKHLLRRCQDPSTHATFAPLLAVMRLVGNLYSAREWSIPLQNDVETLVSQASSTDPVTVQCRLLYSIALFWHDRKADAKSQVDAAIQLALDLNMHRCEFARQDATNDPLLQECWRRTWWMVYTVDAYYAGTLGTMNFSVANIDTDVDLPCEEMEYQRGEIPPPKTLEEFETREFAPDEPIFSSFAYLIGAVRCAAIAILSVPKTARKEDSTQVIQAADAALNGWVLLLPKNHKQVMSKTGEIDELMFQAHLLIHVATIGLHRPYSDLKFSPIEDLSSCAREPPLDTPTPDLVNVHTIRVLRSVEAQIRLLALPAPQAHSHSQCRFHHTPFTTCMISEGTLALLSVCNFLFKAQDLTIARGQIRMAIGCLKALGEVWARTARNVREIQTIAQRVLGLGKGAGGGGGGGSGCRSGTGSERTGVEVPDMVGSEGHGSGSGSASLGSEVEGLSENLGVGVDVDVSLPALDEIEDLCGWHGLGGLDPDGSWGVGTGLQVWNGG